jgi:hypothetical protein
MSAVTTHKARIVVFDDPDYGPSRRMVTVARDVAAQRSDVEVERVDVWQHRDRGFAHGVLTVPTTVIFVGGEERARLCGVRSTRSLAWTIGCIMPFASPIVGRLPLSVRLC